MSVCIFTEPYKLTQYAPEAPWDEHEIYCIFEQTIRQLANLAHTDDASKEHYNSYLRILHLLAKVRIGIVLVDMARNAGNVSMMKQHLSNAGQHANDNDDDDDGSMSSSSHEPSPTSRKNRRQEEQDNHDDENPLELLCELFHTLLQSLRNTHAPIVAENVQQIVSHCIEEYEGGRTTPLPLMEEILICVGQARVLVYDLSKASATTSTKNTTKKGLANANARHVPFQEVPNPAHVVAIHIIRKHLDNLSIPVSNLLNGILNAEPHIVQNSNILAIAEGEPPRNNNNKLQQPGGSSTNSNGVDVWEIIYQLGRHTPKILTTVMGTVAMCLDSPDAAQRLQAVQLLGRLFYAHRSNLATTYANIFRRWLTRCHDAHPPIRLLMVRSIVNMLAGENNTHNKQILQEADHALVFILQCDSHDETRLRMLHDVCDYIFEHNKQERPVSIELVQVSISVQRAVPMRIYKYKKHFDFGWTFYKIKNTHTTALLLRIYQAVGSRVQSKTPTERQSCLTALSQIYARHYTFELLKEIHHATAAGNADDGQRDEDDHLELISRVLHENCRNADVFSTSSTTTKTQEMAAASRENEKFKWIASRIFECMFFSDNVDSGMRQRLVAVVDTVILGNSSKKNGTKCLTPTARAVGLAIIVDSLRKPGESVWGSHDTSNAYKWMVAFLQTRAVLQKAFMRYLDARNKVKEYRAGTCFLIKICIYSCPSISFYRFLHFKPYYQGRKTLWLQIQLQWIC